MLRHCVLTCDDDDDVVVIFVDLQSVVDESSMSES